MAAQAEDKIHDLWDMWYAIMYWTCATYILVYFCCGVYMSIKVVRRCWLPAIVWLPVISTTFGFGVGFISGSVSALMICLVLRAGNFAMTQFDAGLWALGQSAYYLWGSLGRHLPHRTDTRAAGSTRGVSNATESVSQ